MNQRKTCGAAGSVRRKEPFEMSEQQNSTPETAVSGGSLKPDASAQPRPDGNAAADPAASGGLKPKLMLLWRWFNLVVDYIVEEDPNLPKKSGAPESALKKCLNPHKTILLLSNDSVNPVYKTVGRVCRLTARSAR